MHVLLCSTLCMFSSVLYMRVYKSWDVLYGLVSCELRILLLLPRTTRVGQSARIDRHNDYTCIKFRLPQCFSLSVTCIMFVLIIIIISKLPTTLFFLFYCL